MTNKTKKILIAEDETALGNAVKLKLTKEGYEVVWVQDGATVGELAKDGKFDLILLDLIMPVADGFKALEDIKANKIKTPVIVLSNLSQEDDARKCKELGAVDFFVKSNMSMSEIVENVKKVLN